MVIAASAWNLVYFREEQIFQLWSPPSPTSTGVQSGINELTFESLLQWEELVCGPAAADMLQSEPPQTHLMKDSFNMSQDLLSLSLLLTSLLDSSKNAKSQSSYELSAQRWNTPHTTILENWLSVVGGTSHCVHPVLTMLGRRTHF